MTKWVMRDDDPPKSAKGAVAQKIRTPRSEIRNLLSR